MHILDQLYHDSIMTRIFDISILRDKGLRKKEFKKFRRLVKRIARNKGCAKNFWRYCDTDSDGQMTKEEWNSCLGINELKDGRQFLGLYKPYII